MINKYAKMLTQIDDSQLAKYKVLVRVDGVFYETEGDLAGAFTIRENAGDRLRQIYPVEGSILMGGSEVCAIVLSNTGRQHRDKNLLGLPSMIWRRL